MVQSIQKTRTLISLRSNYEYIQHCLLGTVLAHLVKKPSSTSKFHIILDNNEVMDLTLFAKAFWKDPKNQKRLELTVMAILVNGILRSYEAAKSYYIQKDRKRWYSYIQWDTPFRVAGQIRNLGAHNFTWKFSRYFKDGLKDSGYSFPLKFKKICIKREWNDTRATLGQLSPSSIIRLIKNIETYVNTK